LIRPTTMSSDTSAPDSMAFLACSRDKGRAGTARAGREAGHALCWVCC
jgi:hypothetical protein